MPFLLRGPSAPPLFLCDHPKAKEIFFFFFAIIKVDAFFADIIRRPQDQYSKLYDVTSTLSELILNDPANEADGILYTSVNAESQPLIAIKPKSVDDKVTHISAETIEVEEAYPYSVFKTRTLDTAIIGAGGKLVWESSPEHDEAEEEPQTAISETA